MSTPPEVTTFLDYVGVLHKYGPQIVWFIPQALQLIGIGTWLFASIKLFDDHKWSKHYQRLIKSCLVWGVGKLLAQVVPAVLNLF